MADLIGQTGAGPGHLPSAWRPGRSDRSWKLPRRGRLWFGTQPTQCVTPENGMRSESVTCIRTTAEVVYVSATGAYSPWQAIGSMFRRRRCRSWQLETTAK
jgi:hypothetical protein